MSEEQRRRKREGDREQQRERMRNATEELYSAANDPETANDPRPEMIPKLDRK